MKKGFYILLNFVSYQDYKHQCVRTQDILLTAFPVEVTREQASD